MTIDLRAPPIRPVPLRNCKIAAPLPAAQGERPPIRARESSSPSRRARRSGRFYRRRPGLGDMELSKARLLAIAWPTSRAASRPAPTSFTARSPGPDLCGLSMRLRVMPAAIFAQSACEQGETGVRREAGEEYEVEVLYDEGVANHIGPEPCAVDREVGGEASAGGGIGQPSSRERLVIPGAVAHPVRRASDPRT